VLNARGVENLARVS